MLNENIVQFKQIPAFQDNYIWMICQSGRAWVIDPGDAAPIIDQLNRDQLMLEGILVTHHHNDHVGGIEDLRSWANSKNKQIKVVGPLNEEIPQCNQAVIEGDCVQLFDGLELQVFEVPGHTRGHIAYYLPKGNVNPIPRVFCGDTLFASGCGRLFEGTAEQMNRSLAKLSALPKETLVCCAHEYTLSNIRFSQAVEVNNPDVTQWAMQASKLRESNQPTVPTTIGHELLVNPFLRCSHATVIRSASSFAQKDLKEPAEVFAALRSWKDIFK